MTELEPPSPPTPQTSKVATIAAAHAAHDTYSAFLPPLLLLPLGFAGLMPTPILMAFVQESAPENRALANGMYMALNFGTRSVIVVVVGAFADLAGMHVAFVTCASLGLLGTIFVLRLPRSRAPNDRRP